MAHVNHGGDSDRMSNCAMCTMAAILGTHTGTLQTLFGAKDQSDASVAKAFRADHLSSHAQRALVTRRIAEFLTRSLKAASHGTPFDYKIHGGTGNYLTAARAQQIMMAERTGTRFAVWGYETEEMEGLGAHWNYAERTALGVTFRDYQNNTAADIPAGSAPHFLAPGANRANDKKYNSFIVVAVFDTSWIAATPAGGARSGLQMGAHRA